MIKMDRDSKWGSMMSCLESVKEYAQELLESDDICFNDYEYFRSAYIQVEAIRGPNVFTYNRRKSFGAFFR